MAARLLKDTCPLAAAILNGDHDDDLSYIAQAIQARKKAMFRAGTRVRLVGTRNPEVEGQEGVVLKVNATRITVGIGAKDDFGYEREMLVPPAMLEVLS